MATRGKGAKTKGKGFELKIAQLLSKQWDMQLVRTPASGGTHWKGDIIPKINYENFPLCIECKKQEGWAFEQLFSSDNPVILKWWEQTIKETPSNKIPILFFTKNYQSIYVMLYKEHLLKTNRRPKKYIHFNDMIIILLDDFLKISLGKWKRIIHHYMYNQ